MRHVRNWRVSGGTDRPINEWKAFQLYMNYSHFTKYTGFEAKNDYMYTIKTTKQRKPLPTNILQSQNPSTYANKFSELYSEHRRATLKCPL